MQQPSFHGRIVNLFRILKLYSRYSPVKAVVHRMDLAKEKIHRLKVLQFYRQFIKEDDLCFDVGANVGKMTEIFLKLGAKVVCVEPQQICVERLYKLFEGNERVIIVPKGLADKPGHAELAICDEATTVATISDRWKTEGRFSDTYKWTRTQKIELTTLDALIAEYGVPAFCKIDVEGVEEAVLKGLTRPIPFISFEFTKEFLHTAWNCMKHLLSIGRVEFNCSISESAELLLSHWVSPKELYRRLESSKDPLLWGDIYARFLK